MQRITSYTNSTRSPSQFPPWPFVARCRTPSPSCGTPEGRFSFCPFISEHSRMLPRDPGIHVSAPRSSFLRFSMRNCVFRRGSLELAPINRRITSVLGQLNRVDWDCAPCTYTTARCSGERGFRRPRIPSHSQFHLNVQGLGRHA